jgi:hypothetical protein
LQSKSTGAALCYATRKQALTGELLPVSTDFKLLSLSRREEDAGELLNASQVSLLKSLARTTKPGARRSRGDKVHPQIAELAPNQFIAFRTQAPQEFSVARVIEVHTATQTLVVRKWWPVQHPMNVIDWDTKLQEAAENGEVHFGEVIGQVGRPRDGSMIQAELETLLEHEASGVERQRTVRLILINSASFGVPGKGISKTRAQGGCGSEDRR